MVRLDLEKMRAMAKSTPPYKGVKGSIVRLKINDFMTYHKVELRAGANINLILGPNGTGKSTIVCAICIGLAGKPKILSRASALKEYIRHGCSSASIEIELYNPSGTNYVVKRYIKETHTGASSTWALNGVKTQPINVEKLLSGLNIQLDNLCQFLPQDRVQEFSKMDPFSLLRSTQEAMGKTTLTEKHDRLMMLNEMVKQLEYGLKSSTDSLRAEQQYNQRLENEVKNYHERERMKDKVQLLTGKKAWLVYQKSVTAFTETNGELVNLTKKKKDEESRLAPMKKSVNAMESRLARFRTEMNNCRSNNVAQSNAIRRKYEEECDRVEIKVNEINAELGAKENAERDRIKRFEACCAKLHNLEQEYEVLRERGDLDDARLQEEINALKQVTTKMSGKIFDIEASNNQDEMEKRSLSSKINQAEGDLARLDDLRVSRMRFLQREHKDVFRAVEFLSKPENRTGLKGMIHEPMILHLCVNDLRYGAHVEKAIGIDGMVSYMVEDKDDLEVILEMMKPLNIRISVVHCLPPKPGDGRPKGLYGPDFLRKFGFEKCLIDLVEAPEYYLHFLVQRNSFARIPVGTDKTDNYMDDISKNTNLVKWFTQKTLVSTKTSNYGGYKCTTSGFISPARIFTTQINASEKERLEELVKGYRNDCMKLEVRIRSRAPEFQKYTQGRREAEDKLKDIQARIQSKNGLVQKLETARKSKEMLETGERDLEGDRERANEGILKERLKLLDAMEWATTEMEKNAEKGQRFMILKRQVSWLQSRIITKQNTLEEMEVNINQYNGEIRKLETEVKTRAEEAKKNKEEAIAKSGLNESPSDLKSISEESIDKELALLNVQMTFLVETNSSIIKDYEERRKRIDKMTREREGNMDKLADLKKETEELKAEWLGPLNTLIDQINENFGGFFRGMGCAGEVSLCTGDDENDFSKFGIKIMVKFRASEPLAEMCGARGGTLQSGGERVITTALYVLALQELTVVPFRVIDEINQGMDAKNEARFFALLSSLAKGDKTPQYFLLSPKMLPQVDYPDNVTFHFIMNGPKVNVPIRDGSDGEDSDSGSDQENAN